MKWEYKEVYTALEFAPRVSVEYLNGLGANGWELAAIERGAEGVVASYWFKRPKIERTAPDELPASGEG